jgi:hypothetical protein
VMRNVHAAQAYRSLHGVTVQSRQLSVSGYDRNAATGLTEVRRRPAMTTPSATATAAAEMHPASGGVKQATAGPQHHGMNSLDDGGAGTVVGVQPQ